MIVVRDIIVHQKSLQFPDNSKVGAPLIGMVCTLSTTVGQCRVNSPAIKPYFCRAKYWRWTKAIVQGCVAGMHHSQVPLKMCLFVCFLKCLWTVSGEDFLGLGLTLADSRFNSKEVLYDLSNWVSEVCVCFLILICSKTMTVWLVGEMICHTPFLHCECHHTLSEKNAQKTVTSCHWGGALFKFLT